MSAEPTVLNSQFLILNYIAESYGKAAMNFNSEDAEFVPPSHVVLVRLRCN